MKVAAMLLLALLTISPSVSSGTTHYNIQSSANQLQTNHEEYVWINGDLWVFIYGEDGKLIDSHVFED